MQRLLDTVASVAGRLTVSSGQVAVIRRSLYLMGERERERERRNEVWLGEVRCGVWGVDGVPVRRGAPYFHLFRAS